MKSDHHCDVLILGAGSAGSAAAARLSEDPSTKVTIVDAGPDWRSDELIPELRNPWSTYAWEARFADRTFVHPDISATPFDAAPAQEYIRGWGLGGSSVVNGCYAIRPPSDEFDEWGAGWGYDDVLPSFRRLENDIDFGDEHWHSRLGPVPITRLPRELWGSGDDLLAASAQELGHPWAEDQNAPGAVGVSPAASNIYLGSRVSTNDAYLESARTRQNLTIMGRTVVDRLEIVGTAAVGAHVIVDGEPQYLSADRVVIAAGAIGSPAILQRSGIGPGAVLRAAGVQQRAELPVGENVQDHFGCGVELLADATRPARNGQRANCTVRLRDAGVTSDALVSSLNPASTGAPSFRMLVAAARSYSRGHIAITGTDPRVQPAVHLRMLSDDRDVVRARALVRQVLELSGTAAASSITEVRDDLGVPIPSSPTDGQLDDVIRRTFRDTAHISGSCQLGSVVDERLCVTGIDGLWVGDASVFPFVPSANTHLTAIMVGERIAEFVRDGHRS